MLIPNIGQVVLRFKDNAWQDDWVAIVKIRDLVTAMLWGSDRSYFIESDKWRIK